MGMMTVKEYIESLRALDLEVYFFSQKIENIVDEPMFQPHSHAVTMIYELHKCGSIFCYMPSGFENNQAMTRQRLLPVRKDITVGAQVTSRFFSPRVQPMPAEE